MTLNPINDYNKKLKWRSDHNFYVGIRFTLFDHLSANVRYYNTLSKDVVTRIKDNVVNGSAWKWNNGGEIRNSGLEFGLNADILKDVNGLSLLAFYGMEHSIKINWKLARMILWLSGMKVIKHQLFS